MPKAKGETFKREELEPQANLFATLHVPQAGENVFGLGNKNSLTKVNVFLCLRIQM